MKLRTFLLFYFAVYVAALNSGKVLMKSRQRNQYLRLCGGCDKQGKDLAKLDSNIGSQSRWTIEVIGKQVAFKASNGKYLTRRCQQNCPQYTLIAPEDFKITPESLWFYRQESRGIWTFTQVEYNFNFDQQISFLGRCSNCLTLSHSLPGIVTTIRNNRDLSNYITHWILEQLIPFPTGKMMLKSNSGKVLANCNNGCGPGSYPDSATVLPKSVGDPSQIWQAEQVGDKIALKNMNGKYLSRCKFCWAKQSVYVHSSSYSEGLWALWTPERLANGNWALKGDNGKYLAYCTACSVVPIASTDRTVDEYAFVNAVSSSDAQAQWEIVVL